MKRSSISEIKRQLDKSNNNHIGYFHQNIFNFIGKEQGWFVPERGFDIENTLQKIFVEMKNKHNTMNSSSSQKTFIKMQSQIMQDPESTCYLVEVIAKKSQNIPWRVSLDGSSFLDERIRRISIDQFYELVTGNPLAFCKLCEVLPYALEHVVSDLSDKPFCNTVFQEIHPYSADTLKGIYKKSFETYTGFQSMEFKNG